jgi:hypothetical protein
MIPAGSNSSSPNNRNIRPIMELLSVIFPLFE